MFLNSWFGALVMGRSSQYVPTVETATAIDYSTMDLLSDAPGSSDPAPCLTSTLAESILPTSHVNSQGAGKEFKPLARKSALVLDTKTHATSYNMSASSDMIKSNYTEISSILALSSSKSRTNTPYQTPSTSFDVPHSMQKPSPLTVSSPSKLTIPEASRLTTVLTFSASSSNISPPKLVNTSSLAQAGAPKETAGCKFVTSKSPSLNTSSAVSGTSTYCTCGETFVGIKIATSASYTTSYCVVGESVPSGFTEVPAENGHIIVPPKYGQGNWSTSKCSVALTGNTGYSNLQMWTEADAAGAWNYVANLHYDGSIDWSSFIARELNFSSWQEYQCQELSTNNNCMYQEDCDSPITPGAWMVVNSIANLWGKYHWDLYNTIQTAHTRIDVDLVVNNFSPQFDEAAYLQHEIFLTGLTLGIMMGIGALFSFGAEFAVAAADLAATAAEAAEIASTEAGLIADGVAPEEAATRAAQIAKSDTQKKYEHAGKIATILLAHDTLAGVAMFEIMSARYADGNAEDGLAAQNVLTDLISNYTNQWQNAEAGFISQLFNGSESSIKNVGDAIVNGTWLTPWNETSSHDNFTSTSLPLIEKHLYGLMVPYAWAAATKSKNQIMPVVIMADGCLKNITDLIPKAEKSEPPMRFDKNVDNSKICFEGKTFWLLTPYKTGHDQLLRFESGIEYSDRVRFEIPPGLTMLTGASDVYGGLQIEDIIISSYYGWGNNTFMNPTTKPDSASILQNEAWIQSVQYPGFFNYAICDGLPGILAAAQSFWDKEYTSPC